MQTFFVTFQGVTLAILLVMGFSATSVAGAVLKTTQKSQSNISIANANKVSAQNRSQLSTDMSFNDLNVNGRRQSPFGSTAVVEDDKKSLKFVDFRTSYADRIQQSKSGR